MKVEHINPFIESVSNLFSTMLSATAERSGLALAKTAGGSYDITALIGMSGPARGSISMSFPNKTALAMVNRLLGTEVDKVDTMVTDAMAEMVNIVAGSAKKYLTRTDSRPIELSLPNVVKGKNFLVMFPSQSVWLEVPFESDLGPFALRVIFEPGTDNRL